jgi:GTPase SAR1 family protein
MADRVPRSCLLHRFVKNEWRVLSSQTIGVEFASKIIKVGTGARRKRIKLQVRHCPLDKHIDTRLTNKAMGYSRNRKISICISILLPWSSWRNPRI